MNLGAFSISLHVEDIHASLAFYKILGFEEIGGSIDQNWLILKNGDSKIGLFQGMIGKNTLTFNPGWTANAEPFDPFDDVRTIQVKLREAGLTLVKEADADGEGPDFITLIDPDGNPVLIDQHR